jgi:hypothetical protein
MPELHVSPFGKVGAKSLATITPCGRVGSIYRFLVGRKLIDQLVQFLKNVGNLLPLESTNSTKERYFLKTTGRAGCCKINNSSKGVRIC